MTIPTAAAPPAVTTGPGAPLADVRSIDELVDAVSGQDLRLHAVDLYRDIHKGIRAELFALTSSAGSADPASAGDRAAVADHVHATAAVLGSHAEHEDGFIEPVLEEHLPAVAERIAADHAAFEARFAGLGDLAVGYVGAHGGEARRLGHLLHLELSRFVGTYLDHLWVEERVVMPALEEAIGPDAVAAIHQAIVTSIPPDEMARSLAFMLPAMNVEDRVELLGGIRLGAPPEAFAGVVALAGSVLRPDEHAELQARLGTA